MIRGDYVTFFIKLKIIFQGHIYGEIKQREKIENSRHNDLISGIRENETYQRIVAVHFNYVVALI